MSAGPMIDVLTPDGKVAQRRATVETVEGQALLGAARFPIGGLEPIPRAGEAVEKRPKGSKPAWRVYRTGARR